MVPETSFCIQKLFLIFPTSTYASKCGSTLCACVCLANQQIFNECLKYTWYDSKTFFLELLSKSIHLSTRLFVSHERGHINCADTNRYKKERHKAHIFITNFLAPISTHVYFPSKYYPNLNNPKLIFKIYSRWVPQFLDRRVFWKWEIVIISTAILKKKEMDFRSTNWNTKSGIFSGAFRQQTKVMDVKTVNLWSLKHLEFLMEIAYKLNLEKLFIY